MKYKATKSGQIVGKRGKFLKLIPKPNGYLHFSKSAGYGNPQQTLVHRFVWEYFNGHIPGNMCIDHIDGDRHNNKLENLQLMTSKENTRKDGNILSKDKAEEIRRRRFAGESGTALAREFGVSEQLVCDIKMGRKWY